MTNFHESRIKNKNLLEPELGYKIQGCVYNVANKYGKGLKEQIYQKALAEEFTIVGFIVPKGCGAQMQNFCTNAPQGYRYYGANISIRK